MVHIVGIWLMRVTIANVRSQVVDLLEYSLNEKKRNFLGKF
jgi:hypothetical protein